MVPCKSAMSLKQNLINSIRRYSGLYDPADKNYRDRNYSSIAWTEIAKECQLPSVARAKSIWASLRKIYKYSLSNPNYKKPEYYSSLKYLFQSIKNSNYEDSDDEVQFILKKERSDDDEETVTDTLERTSLGTSVRNRRRHYLDNRPSTSGRHSVRRDHENPSSSHQNNPQRINQPDEMKLFMDSMYLMAKKLPPALQRHVRNQIFEIIKTAESSAVIEEIE
ncbi:uncharacterized protein LOC123274736 [Cotesia glomerata]|uniref:MADF domain-containing protein n=1 Tax=Cotesia glomerata TaxID=32391 RepID=A0AAV7J6F1_COTGL|nr:uncharacterized protein LOC123274736 [Cotesia glomerata]KAH0566976.1 hypothetical protein KQX54_005843 [Cotesia glomerata]